MGILRDMDEYRQQQEERLRKLEKFAEALYEQAAPVIQRHVTNELIFGIPMPSPEEIAAEAFPIPTEDE